MIIAVLATMIGLAIPEQGERKEVEEAVFAGGCFWCMEPVFSGIEGVLEVRSGYVGGETDSPTYEEVCSGRTGHAEAVSVLYDSKVVGYERLLDVYWRNIDPFDGGGQFVDRGPQYRPGIFWTTEEQRDLALASVGRIEAELGRPVRVEVTRAGTFYPAEGYHQGYAERNPLRYRMYRAGSGRDQTLDRIWGPGDKH